MNEMTINELNATLVLDDKGAIIPEATEAPEYAEMEKDLDLEAMGEEVAPADEQKSESGKLLRPGRVIATENDMVEVEKLETLIAKEVDEVTRAIHQRKLLAARIIGEERVGDEDVKIVAQLRGALKVYFNAKDFFRLSRMPSLEDESPEVLQSYYLRKSRRMHGASVLFLPLEIIGAADDGIPVIHGSRSVAMEVQRHRHFFGPKANVAVGVRTVAEILSTGPDYVIASVLGVETRIWAKDLSAFKYIEDVSGCAEFQPGKGIEVLVTDLKVDKEAKSIEISVSRAMLERSILGNNQENLKLIRKGGTYSATVIGVRDKFYRVILDGYKVVGFIRRQDNKSNEMLNLQDRVSMMVYGHNFEKGYVWGGCYKS